MSLSLEPLMKPFKKDPVSILIHALNAQAGSLLYRLSLHFLVTQNLSVTGSEMVEPSQILCTYRAQLLYIAFQILRNLSELFKPPLDISFSRYSFNCFVLFVVCPNHYHSFKQLSCHVKQLPLIVFDKRPREKAVFLH